MFQWLQDGVAWLLQLICGHGWTGGMEGAIPFAIGCAVVFVAGLCIIGRPDQNSEELQGFADGEEDQVYAYELDSTNALTTSGGHHYNY